MFASCQSSFDSLSMLVMMNDERKKEAVVMGGAAERSEEEEKVRTRRCRKLHQILWHSTKGGGRHYDGREGLHLKKNKLCICPSLRHGRHSPSCLSSLLDL